MKPLILLQLNSDQRREYVNTRQRFQAWLEAKRRKDETRGSMTWATAKGGEYLARSAYDKRGVRRQTSLGPRSAETEKLKQEYERGRQEANERFGNIDDALKRQVAVNRALGLGRVPLTAAKVLRSIDAAGLLGAGLRVIGTNAIYAYEASAGVFVEPGVTATGDIDLLFDSRRSIRFLASDHLAERTLMNVLKGFDDSFERTSQTYQATNKEGYAVDLIKPMRSPPWVADTAILGDNTQTDLTAAEIEGLVWLENAPTFESMVIDEKGVPLRLISIDPRVFVAHKLWLSERDTRDPVKKSRDAEQAQVVAQIVVQHLPHLRYDSDDMRMLPKELADAASKLFV